MEMDITEFYDKKTVFLTGGSGFLGRVIIEKLLRSTNVSRIYVMVRHKRGKSSQERINEWITDPLFELVLKTKPNAFDRIVAVTGDCVEPDLGISFEDRERIKKETHVVIHSAATVNFTLPLQVALDTNTRATRLMLQLAREMNNFQAFVHVSTAFSNCVIHHLEERFYPEHISCSADKVLTLREICDERVFKDMEKVLMEKFPNTYTYTKALAEQVIQTESAGMAVCVFRPGSILATSEEPVSGWINNLYGPIAVIYGCAMGILRVAPFNRDALSSTVPADYCANLVIASAWKTAKDTAERSSDTTPVDPTVYNYVPHERNVLKNSTFWDSIHCHRKDFPLSQSIWYPFVFPMARFWVYKLYAFFLHLVPGYIIDFVLQIRGQKPRLIPLYNKVHRTLDALAHFSTKKWSFTTANMDKLWQSMSAADRRLFQCDMKTFDWDAYFLRTLVGMRIYLGKEDPGEESLKRAQEHFKRLERRHRLLIFVLVCALVATLKCLISLFF